MPFYQTGHDFGLIVSDKYHNIMQNFGHSYPCCICNNRLILSEIYTAYVKHSVNKCFNVSLTFSKGLKGAAGEKGKSGQSGKKAC